MRFWIAVALLVAFAGFAGGCGQGDTQNDPAADKAFADQLKQAAAGNAIRNKPPKHEMPNLKGGSTGDAAKSDEKSDAASKPGATDQKPVTSGN